MRRGKRFAPVAFAMGLLCFGCGDNAEPRDPGTDPDPDPGKTDKVLMSVSLSPSTALIAIGEQTTLAVTGQYDDGTAAAITTGVTWSSSDAALVAVDGGTATGKAHGTATITAKVGGKEARADVTTGVYGFTERFAPGIGFMPFGGSKTDVSVDTTSSAHTGKSSLAFKVVGESYAGGAFRIATPTDLSGYDALTFWARAERNETLDTVGFGNSAGSTPPTYQTEIHALPLTPTWTRFVIPLPVPSLLTGEVGIFHIAEGPAATPFTIWLDDIRYEKLGDAIGAPQPAIATSSFSKGVGDSFDVTGPSAIYKIGDVNQVVIPSLRYFTFASSDEAVAKVTVDGKVSAIGVGTANITAKLGKFDAAGTLSVTVAVLSEPSVSATVPVALPTDVIAMFSDTYAAVTVDTWCAGWSEGSVADFAIGTVDHIKKYTNVNFVGIDFSPHQIDATAMTHFHVDVWLPAMATFRVKLVDFGANGTWQGGDDVEQELSFNASTTPAIAAGSWVSLDLPLSSFTNLTTRGHLAQLIFGTDTRGTVYVDNVYFHKAQ